MIDVATGNAKALGLEGAIRWARRGVEEARPPAGVEPGIVVTNPPYGERLGETAELFGLYAELGDRLRQRFWQDAPIGRLDRVLVLEARSLLWALDPLQAASEGEVVITLAASADQERLQAQLQLLDQLRRPQLLMLPPEQPSALADRLDVGWRFDWLAARQPWRPTSSSQSRGSTRPWPATPARR
jgi:hypothetical protein